MQSPIKSLNLLCSFSCSYGNETSLRWTWGLKNDSRRANEYWWIFLKFSFFNSPTLPPLFFVGSVRHQGAKSWWRQGRVRCCKPLPCTGLEHDRGKMWKQTPAGLVLVLPTGLQQTAACSWHGHSDWLHLCAHGNLSPMLTLPQFTSLHPVQGNLRKANAPWYSLLQ